jgi:hypothetical protein
MFATAGNSNCVYVWDYEYLKLLFTIKLPDGVEATAL